jgi:hypothetical protein
VGLAARDARRVSDFGLPSDAEYFASPRAGLQTAARTRRPRFQTRAALCYTRAAFYIKRVRRELPARAGVFRDKMRVFKLTLASFALLPSPPPATAAARTTRPRRQLQRRPRGQRQRDRDARALRHARRVGRRPPTDYKNACIKCHKADGTGGTVDWTTAKRSRCRPAHARPQRPRQGPRRADSRGRRRHAPLQEEARRRAHQQPRPLHTPRVPPPDAGRGRGSRTPPRSPRTKHTTRARAILAPRAARAPVAQLDRASDFESEGRRFEPYRVYQSSQ